MPSARRMVGQSQARLVFGVLSFVGRDLERSAAPEKAMTPDEWFTSDSSHAMLQFLIKRKRRAPPSRRKIILFAAANGHIICDIAGDPQATRGLKLAEEMADGRIWCAECDALSSYLNVDKAYASAAHTILRMAELTSITDLVEQASQAEMIMWDRLYYITPEERPRRPSVILRELFGDPFQVGSPHSPPTMRPNWRTDTAVAIARQMYESRDFDAMPILADSLQDAGCDNDDVLAHCRDPHQVHVRGCWVVDLVLGLS